jgi:uncharacterized protein (TIGR04255 family)
MGEKIPIPPLIEAICEFRFVPAGEWDWTLPGRLYEKIGNEFHERSQVKNLQVHIGSKDPDTQVISGLERVQLKRPDGSAMVQIGPNLLAINHLRPYPEWHTFMGMILSIYEKYIELIVEPKLARIGLRYINQISLPVGGYKLGDYISLEPQLKGTLERPILGFYLRYEFSYDSPKGVLIHQTGIQKTDQGNVLMLDLDFGSLQIDQLEEGTIPVRSAIESWLNGAHDLVLDCFKESISLEFYERLRRGEG